MATCVDSANAGAPLTDSSELCAPCDVWSDPVLVDAVAELQETQAPPCGYLSSTQAGSGMAACHRAAVVDCLVTSSARLGLSNDSLFLGVALLDRFLAARPLPLHLLQPAGVACLWIASKFEQPRRLPPAPAFAAQLLGPRGGPVPRHEAASLLAALEASVLRSLDFKLAGVVTANSFAGRLLQARASSSSLASRSSSAASGGSSGGGGVGVPLRALQLQKLACMTSYLTEVSLLEYKLLPCLPSMVAAAAYAYAHALLGLRLDKDALQAASGHSFASLAAPIRLLSAAHGALGAALQAARPYALSVKHCEPELHSVAVVPPLTQPGDARLAQAGWL